MKALLMALAMASGTFAFSGGSALAASDAFETRKNVSIRLCTNAVAKRTGSTDITVYRTLSKYNRRSVWMEVGGSHLQFRCLVKKNGPDSYFIQSVRQL